MDATTYYSELMLIFLNIIQLQKLMKKAILTEILFLRENTRSTRKKHLAVNLSKLMQVKKIMMQIMELAEYKHLSVNLKRDN